MQYQDDFRVKMCTEVNDDHFDTVHHELGHIEYFIAYDRNQPYVYREGANAGFHEAIGDTIGIFASKFFFFWHTNFFIFDMFFSITDTFNNVGFS